METITKSAKETEKFGASLAKEISQKETGQKAVVFGLEGELGAGKTTFVKGFAKALGIKEKILSPTFVLMKNYKLNKNLDKLAIHPLENSRGDSSRAKAPTKKLLLAAISRGSRVGGMADLNYGFLIHIDAYRLKDYRDLIPLGIKEILDSPENMVLIEWSDRVKEILPKKYLKVHIDHISEKERKIVIN